MITYEQARDLIKQNPARIGYYVGFDDLTELHNEWLRDILFKPGDQTKQAHRGSYKTSCDSLAIALNTVIRPWERLIFLRKTDDDVHEVIRQAKEILQTGAFREIARALTGAELSLTKDSVSEIDTTLKQGIAGASQVVGYGIGSSLTGKHADTIITDDIVNIRDRISRADREKTKLIYQELQNVKNRGGRIINTGTPWHKDDAFSIMPPAEKYDCYSTGLISKNELKNIRSSMTPSLFAANYELKHIADEETLFTDSQWIDDDTLIYDGVGHIDASYGGADYTAYTAINCLSDGRIIAIGKLWHQHVDKCIGEIIQLQNKYKIGPIYNENNADKGYLASNLEDRGLVVFSYHESMNKYVKISTFLTKAWKNIYWLNETDPEYIDQILDYNLHAPHDDAPDSIASLLRETEETAQYVPVHGSLF
jgi:predicted phage terminase large subunit-like protein